jgi:hypothetical protein
LVEKDDYDMGDKRALLKHLVVLSCSEDGRNREGFTSAGLVRERYGRFLGSSTSARI